MGWNYLCISKFQRYDRHPTLYNWCNYQGRALSNENFLHSDSFFIEPTNEIEIINIISCLKEGSCGRAEIVSSKPKCVSNSVAYPLAQFANLSFQRGLFPKELKIAVITQLYQAKDPTMTYNCRPISLIFSLAKNLGRLMYKRFLKFVNKYRFFTNVNLDFAISIQNL